MAAKSFDPTANPFELLASAESQQEDATLARKKVSRKQDEAALPAGATALTPAEKAKARAAKEAAKAKTQENTPNSTQTQGKEAKKLSKEQFLEEKRKGTLDAVEQAESPSTRPARARGEAPPQQSSDRSRGNSNHRGRGAPRGGGRGGLGRGRGGEGDKSGRALGDKEHHHQAPVHGREHDKKSGMKTGRHPVAKRGGAGGNNWGDDKDDLVGQTGADNVEPPTDDTEKTAPTDNNTAAPNTTTAPADDQGAPAPAEEEDSGISFDEYLKQKAAKDAALALKVGGAAPRRVEAPVDLDKYKESPHAEHQPKTVEKKEKPEESKKTGPKIISLDEIFDVRTPPISQRGGGRGGRGRGRGGRGGDGGNRENREHREHRDRDRDRDREGDQGEQREQREQREPREPREPRERGGGGGGERGARGGRGRGQGNAGRGQGVGGRGTNRGGQRRQGGGGRAQLDVSNFPDLGSN